jgi:hypothetical protein
VKSLSRSSSNKLRVAFDLFWIAGFAATITLILLRPSGAFAPDRAANLELKEGAQVQVLYRKGQRMGEVHAQIKRLSDGWVVTHLFFSGAENKGGSAARAGKVRTWLRADLSLERLSIEADLSRLGHVSGLSGFLVRQMKDFHEIRIKGRCIMETGICQVSGQVGRHPVELDVTAGRGPVVTSAIYPLLAQGSLGQKAEVTIFDPLSLRQRVVAFTVEGREELTLHSGTFEAIRVLRDLDGMNTRVWIDARGRVLKEELPLGLTVEHASWGSPEAAKKEAR